MFVIARPNSEHRERSLSPLPFMKRLYLDHFDELPGHFDYIYFYASSSSLESIHYG